MVATSLKRHLRNTFTLSLLHTIKAGQRVY